MARLRMPFKQRFGIEFPAYHETQGMAEPVGMPDDIGPEGQEALAIGIIGVNRHTGIVVRGHVGVGTGKCNA
jgi:hypothetical protein